MWGSVIWRKMKGIFQEEETAHSVQCAGRRVKEDRFPSDLINARWLAALSKTVSMACQEQESVWHGLYRGWGWGRTVSESVFERNFAVKGKQRNHFLPVSITHARHTIWTCYSTSFLNTAQNTGRTNWPKSNIYNKWCELGEVFFWSQYWNRLSLKPSSPAEFMINFSIQNFILFLILSELHPVLTKCDRFRVRWLNLLWLITLLTCRDLDCFSWARETNRHPGHGPLDQRLLNGRHLDSQNYK